MKKYQVTFSAMKSVQEWDEENGASGNLRDIDAWSATVELDAKPTRKEFAHFVFEHYGLNTNKFRHWPDEPGRFTTNRIENNDGEEDRKGGFLADYDVRVECRPMQHEVPVGTFGLKSIDQ